MRNRGPSRGRASWLWAVVLAGLGACATQPPGSVQKPVRAAGTAGPAGAAVDNTPLVLLPLAVARSAELAAISITSLDRLLTSGATLAARAVPLPIDPAGLRDLLLGQAGLSPEVAANLDLGSPSGAAVVSTGPVGGTGLVMAVAARGPVEAERVIAALGKPVVKRGAAVLIDNGTGGRGWVVREGNIIILSDDVVALARGARLAQEARHAAAEDVTAVIYPEAVARANGTDVKTAIAAMVAQVQAAQAAQAAGGPAADRQGLDAVTEMLTLAGDAEAVELGLSVDVNKGVVLRARLRAKPGTELESVARDARPFQLDGSVLAGGAPPSLVLATSVGPFARAMMARQRERLKASGAKGAPLALAYYEAYEAGMAGQFSFAMSIGRETPPFSALFAYPLKDAAAAASVFAAMGRLNKDAVLALCQAQMGWVPPFGWTVKKESVGKVKAIRFGVSFDKPAAGKSAGKAPAAAAGFELGALRKVLGKALDVYVAVAGTRTFGAMGRNAKANLSRLAAAKDTPPGGALADALTLAKNRDAFFYLDLGPVLALVGSLSKDPRAAMLSKGAGAPIPLFGTAGGDGAGKAWSVDLTIPPAAFVGAGTVVKSMGGGAAP